LIAAQRAKLEAGGDDDDDDEEVGPEVEIPLEEQQIRRQYAAMVDPRKMMFMRMLPINGVCTVVGNYPVPTWQEVSYFEVYIAKANKYTNVVVGLVTRPYPHWKFPGHCPHSVGMHSRGELLLSTCDFPREARGQPFACHATGVPGDINLGPWQRKVQIMQDTHFSRVVAAGQAGTDEEVVQRRRFTDMAQRWDCVGVMYNRSTGRVRFAINGKQLQPACHIQDRLWYPAIGVDDSCEVYVNFGGQPFRCAEYDYLQHGFGRSLVNPAGEDEVVDDEFDPDDANFE
jgi:hypothetical protein